MYPPFCQLRDLVNALSEDQLKNLWKYLASFNMGSNRVQPKGVKLVKYLEGRPEADYSRARKLLGKKKKKPSELVTERAWQALINRTLEKVLEYLTLGIHYDRTDEYRGKKTYADSTRAKCKIRQALTQADFLFLYKNDETAAELLEEVRNDAAVYELFSPLLDAINLLWELAVLRNDTAKQLILQEERQYFTKVADVALRSKEGYYGYRSRVARSGSSLAFVRELGDQLSDLHAEIKKAPSATAKMYFRFLEHDFLKADERPFAATRCLQMQLELVATHPAVGRQSLVAAVRLLMAEDRLNNLDPTAAHEQLELARVASEDSLVNTELFAEIEARAYIQQNDASAALKSIQKSVKLTDPKDAHGVATRNYIKAVVLYLTGDHKLAHFQLQDTRELDQDPEGWNIGVRIFSIQLSIERDQLDHASNQIESLTKFMRKTGDAGGNFRPRDRAMIKMLRTLERVSYDFDIAAAKCRAELETMHDTKAGCRWEPGTHEVLVFTQWFEARQQARDYKFSPPTSYIEYLALAQGTDAGPILVEA